MNINPKELQKFHDLWAPMISALPAVINAAERANELANHVVILENIAKAAQDDATKASDLKAAQLLAARVELKQVAVEKTELTKAVKLHRTACEERIQAAEASANALVEEHKARVNAAASAAGVAEEELRARTSAMEAEYAAILEAKQAEVKEAETRVLKAADALERLRARLG